MTKENEREKLHNWLLDYDLYRQMRPDAAGECCAVQPVDFTSEPAPSEGQIRLWPAGNLSDEPVYTLLMRGDYGHWRLFPFSPLALPAVPEELRVREEGPVWVIQGWNAKSVPSSIVASSWCVGELPEDIRFRINSWRLAMEDGGGMPDALSMFTGPPLRHPLDPRHHYQEEELQRVDHCLGESMPAVDSDVPELDIAAEPEEGYGEETD
ncbi:MAG: hypothetical protein WD708_06550 [Kiritimatiellia bacterium]